MFTKQFVLFSLGLFALAGMIVARDFTRVSQEALAVYGFQHKSGYDFLFMWLMLFNPDTAQGVKELRLTARTSVWLYPSHLVGQSG